MIQRGKAPGTIRQDATTEDVYIVVFGLATAMRYGSGEWRRYTDGAVEGLGARF